MGVDAEEVTPNATLREDLGAESIDFRYRLPPGKGVHLRPGQAVQNPPRRTVPRRHGLLAERSTFVSGNKLTPTGIAELKKRMPYADYTEFDKNPTIENAQKLLTVGTIVNYVMLIIMIIILFLNQVL